LIDGRRSPVARCGTPWHERTDSLPAVTGTPQLLDVVRSTVTPLVLFIDPTNGLLSINLRRAA
jgi:hypothetical protein